MKITIQMDSSYVYPHPKMVFSSWCLLSAAWHRLDSRIVFAIKEPILIILITSSDRFNLKALDLLVSAVQACSFLPVLVILRSRILAHRLSSNWLHWWRWRIKPAQWLEAQLELQEGSPLGLVDMEKEGGAFYYIHASGIPTEWLKYNMIHLADLLMPEQNQ